MNEEVNKVASENGFVLSGQEIFGRYAKIAYGDKKYGRIPGEQDYHIYKCIQRFRSNCWCDVPLTYQTENNCYNHGEMQDVVNVIHCGIDESKVIRVALKDVEILPTTDYRVPKHGSWRHERPIYEGGPYKGLYADAYECSKCGCYADEEYDYCPHCGAQMSGGDKR